MKRILLISNTDHSDEIKEIINKNIIPTLNEMDCICSIYEMSVPNTMTQEMAGIILSLVKQDNSECILTFDYYPIMSLACGSMGIKYVSWIIAGYGLHVRDYSVKNSWNYIFTPEIELYKEYLSIGVEHVWYLPLAPDLDIGIEEDKLNKSETISHDIEVYYWTECLKRPSSMSDKLPLLMDSTKGYLDGVVETRKSDISINPIYDSLPQYIRDDIEQQYEIQPDSYEKLSQIYDHRLIFSHIDESIGNAYLLQRFCVDDYVLVTDTEIILVDDKTRHISRKDGYNELNTKDSVGICFFVQPLVKGNYISRDMWNAMITGNVVILPDYIDTTFLKDCIIPKFSNNHESERLVRSYRRDWELSNRNAGEIRESCKKCGGYKERLNELISNC